MDIRNLNTFIYTAELSSFTKAAERLGYSQSTVSFQIKQLEHELDTQLLVYLPVKDFEVHVWKQLLYHRDKWVSPS